MSAHQSTVRAVCALELRDDEPHIGIRCRRRHSVGHRLTRDTGCQSHPRRRCVDSIEGIQAAHAHRSGCRGGRPTGRRWALLRINRVKRAESVSTRCSLKGCGHRVDDPVSNLASRQRGGSRLPNVWDGEVGPCQTWGGCLGWPEARVVGCEGAQRKGHVGKEVSGRC